MTPCESYPRRLAPIRLCETIRASRFPTPIFSKSAPAKLVSAPALMTGTNAPSITNLGSSDAPARPMCPILTPGAGEGDSGRASLPPRRVLPSRHGWQHGLHRVAGGALRGAVKQPVRRLRQITIGAGEATHAEFHLLRMLR